MMTESINEFARSLTKLNVTWDLDETDRMQGATERDLPPRKIFIPADTEAQLLLAETYPSSTDVMAEWLSDKYGWCVSEWSYA